MQHGISKVFADCDGETPDEVIEHIAAVVRNSETAQQLAEAERAEADAREHAETARKLEAGEAFTDGWKPAIADPAHYEAMAELRRADAARHTKAAECPPNPEACEALAAVHLEPAKRDWVLDRWNAGKLKVKARFFPPLEGSGLVRIIPSERRLVEYDPQLVFVPDDKGAWSLRYRPEGEMHPSGWGEWRDIAVEPAGDWTEDDDWAAWITRVVLGRHAAEQPERGAWIPDLIEFILRRKWTDQADDQQVAQLFISHIEKLPVSDRPKLPALASRLSKVTEQVEKQRARMNAQGRLK